MRRFELSEGTSHKFWQIDLDDQSFTVTWGRIGTAGQSQVKSFDTADKARAEHDKLVAEKVKKGYAEVGATPGAAAPKPAAPRAAKPSPAPAGARSAAEALSPPTKAEASAAVSSPAPVPRPAAVVAGGIAWTEGARREVAPRRGWDVVAPRKPDAKAAFGKIKEAFLRVAAALDAGLAGKGVAAKLTAAARAAFSGEPQSAVELDAQAAAYALVAPRTGYSDKSRHQDFVRYWSVTEGASFALRALARGAGLPCVATANARYELSALALLDQAPEKSEEPWWRAQEGDTWRALRNAVLIEGEAARPELERLAGELRAGADLETRAILACAFEREDWGREDLEAAIANIGQRGVAPWVWPLVLLAPTVDEASKLFDRMATGHIWTLTRGLEAIRFDLVARFGPPLAPELSSIVERAGAMSADRVRALAEALALIVSPEIARFFLERLTSKELRAIASEYLQTHAEVSAAGLAGAAAGRGPAADAAKAVLKGVVASRADVIAGIKGSLEPAARAVVEALEADAGPREEATAAELPRVLRELPWKRKVKLAAPKGVGGLSPLPLEEGLEWKKGEREEKLQASRWLEENPGKRKENLEAIRVANQGEGAAGRAWQMASASLFAQLPAQDAIAAFNTAALEKFGWSYFSVPELLLARHGLAVLPGLLRLGEVELPLAVETLVRVRSPRVAPLMASAFTRLKKSRGLASGWLLAFPEAAAVGLIPLAVGEPGQARTSAGLALSFLAGRGQRALIESVAARYGAEALEATKAVLDFDPLLVLPKKLPALPAFFSAGAFSRPLLAGRGKALPLESVEAVGTMLAFTSFDEPYPGLLELKEACDPRSLADFAWDLFQAWLVSGAPSKESWAFQAMGLFGDDECARRLTPLVRAWPGEAAHARAVTGLDVLARIGTDVALMHLHGIAQKLKFKGLQEKAREKIDQLAEARGLTAEELADRLVPDLGLDEDGALWLDLGPRKFKVVFDESLRPAVLDDAGKRAADLPKPRQSDDAEKAKEATETWKALRKDAKAIAQGQLLRLELAMCSQRRWTEDVFRRFLLGHPLLVHLVRRLVWGAYDAQSGALVGTFRVAEDSSLADHEDGPFTLPAGAKVGIVHRLELDDALASAWGQVLSDYEILQPFEQLSRGVAAATDEVRASKKLDLVVGLQLATGKVLGLDGRGWRRGPPQDGGVVCWYEKPVQGGLVVSLDLDPGLYTGMLSESPQQKLGSVTVAREGGGSWYGGQHGLTFGELSPLVYSELVRDLESLRS